MNGQQGQPDPPRLVTEQDSLSRLLAESDQAFRAGLAEGPAWVRFQQRSRRRRALLWLVPALACCAALIVQARAWRARTLERPTLTMTAEPVMARPAPSARTEAPPTSTPTLSKAAVLERHIQTASRLSLATHSGEAKLPPLPATIDDAMCRRWASEGKREEAAQCFEALGRGTGLGAEVALYQAARISSDLLHDAPRALALLERHQQRFPGGPLRVEVEWLRVQNLEKVGQLEDALRASEALLATPSGLALGSKLHLLRGRIYAHAKGDCGRAVRELVALLGEPGAEGDEGELERAQCLEQLARPDEARAAYERYTRRTDARHVALAEQRLRALGSGAKPEGQH